MKDTHKRLVFLVMLFLFLGYSSFLYTVQPFPDPPANTAAENGKMVWQNYNCSSCHQIFGLGGYLGPDLTDEYTLRSEAVINSFLISGTIIMPNFHLSEQERSDLIEYLKTVDATGSADPKTFKIYTDGTIEQ